MPHRNRAMPPRLLQFHYQTNNGPLSAITMLLIVRHQSRMSQGTSWLACWKAPRATARLCGGSSDMRSRKALNPHKLLEWYSSHQCFSGSSSPGSSRACSPQGSRQTEQRFHPPQPAESGSSTMKMRVTRRLTVTSFTIITRRQLLDNTLETVTMARERTLQLAACSTSRASLTT